jgi:hypothetical protein
VLGALRDEGPRHEKVRLIYREHHWFFGVLAKTFAAITANVWTSRESEEHPVWVPAALRIVRVQIFKVESRPAILLLEEVDELQSGRLHFRAAEGSLKIGDVLGPNKAPVNFLVFLYGRPLIHD